MTSPLDTSRAPRAKAPRPDPAAPVAPAAVVAFLSENPDFLARNPELYASLDPPERVHGEIFADHMAAIIRAARGQTQAAHDQAASVLTAGRAASGMTARVQEAVLLVLRAAHAGGGVAASVAAELPTALAVDAARLCAEAPAGEDVALLPPGTVATLCAGRAVRFETPARGHPALHGAAAALAETDAVVLIPGTPPMVLALAARAAHGGTDRGPLAPVQGTGALAFLGRAIAAALGR